VHDWLTAKFFALVAYIVLGVFALRQGSTKQVRTTCFVLALVTFGYMVSVALTRSAVGALTWL
jgi:uncharacterized membrane protein SirB2